MADDLSRVFDALANSHRREMVHALAVQPRSISELADQRGLSLPAIHKHIRVLEAAGMVQRRKAGRTNYLAIERGPLRSLQRWVEQFHPDWGSDSEALDNYVAHLTKDTWVDGPTTGGNQ